MKKQKIFSRKIGDSITPSELSRLRSASGLKVVDASLPTMVLVEGDPQSVTAFLKDNDGWRADPVVEYSIPDSRPQPHRQTAGR